MPIVISYTDVKALGSLAQQAGYDTAFAQETQRNRDRDYRYDVLQQQGDIQREQIQANQQTTQFLEQGRERRFSEGLDAADEARKFRLFEQIENIGQRSGLEAEKLQGRFELEDVKQQNRLERIEVESKNRKYKRRSAAEPTLDPGGLPTAEYAKEEVSRFYHLIPTRPPTGSTRLSVDRFGKLISSATDISKLPTDEIQRILDAKPDDKLAPFMTAILADRRSVQGIAPPVDEQDFRGLGIGSGLGAGSGLVPDPILGSLSDEELMNMYNRMPTR